MVACSFCGGHYAPGTGHTLYRKDGTALHYCSRKCERNQALKRVPRKLKWTQKYEKGTTTARKG